MAPGILAGMLIAAAVVAVGGCYDAADLVAQAKEKASLKQLEEIDLGEFSVTLPREEGSTTIVAVRIHPFANVSKQRVHVISEQLGKLRPALRHKVILAVRKATPEELIEPELIRLQERVRRVAITELDAAPIHSIGFKRFEVYEE